MLKNRGIVLDGVDIGKKMIDCYQGKGLIVKDKDTYIQGGYVDDYLLVYLISKMLISGEAILLTTSLTTDENLRYYKKLKGEK